MRKNMRKLALIVGLFALVAVGVTTLLQPTTEAAFPLPPIDCSIVLCPAPDCPAGTKAVILPGDCCFSCVPTGGGGK